MTLALAGKTPRRKTVLVLAATFAVIISSLAGLGFLRTAFAHHDDYTASATCEGWQAAATYDGGDSRRLLVIRDVTINGDDYAPAWSTDAGDGSPFGDDPIGAYTLSDSDFWDNAPGNGTKYQWDDTDNGFSIFNRSGGAGTLQTGGNDWSGEFILYTQDLRYANPPGPEGWGWYTKWTRVDHDDVTAPTAPTGCQVNIQIHKYLPMDNVNNPWQNQGAGQGDWLYTIYADNAGVPGAVIATGIDHLNPSPLFAKQTVWLKETDTDGDTFFGWFVPDGDNNSGNDHCNQAPADFTTGVPDARYSREEYLKINASFFDTTGNPTGLFHICAYNEPAEPPPDGYIEVYKVVTNVANDPTLFDADIDGGAPFTFSELAYSGNHPVAVGAHTVTEAAEAGYNTKGWAIGTGGGSPVCPERWTSSAGDNSAEISVASNNTTIVCFYNEKELPGFIEVYKVVTNVADDPTLFDADIDGGAPFTFSELAYSGNHPVAVGAHVVTEAAEPGYNTLGWALWTGNPQAVCPAEPTHSGDSSAEITVASNNTTVICFYNEVSTGKLIVKKVNSGGPAGDGFTADISGGNQDIPFSQATPSVEQVLDAGVYTVSEDSQTGYVYKGFTTSTDGSCTGEPSMATPDGNVPPSCDETTTTCFYTEAVGTIRIVKTDTTLAGDLTRPAGDIWHFNVTGGIASQQITGSNAVTIPNVPMGTYGVTEVEFHSSTACPALPNVDQQGYFSTATNLDNVLNTPGEMIEWAFTNEPCPSLRAAPNLTVRKVIDFNGNGIQDGADYAASGWMMTASCALPAQATGADGAAHFDGTAEGTCTVSEATQAGYNATVRVTKLDSGTTTSTTGSSVTVSQDLNDNNLVTFYNQPLGSIEVTKTTVTSHNGESDQPAPQDRDGWRIIISSAACGVGPMTGTTDTNGKVTFNNLPVCSDYVVAEDLAFPGASDYLPVGASSVGGVTPDDPAATVSFTNRKSTFFFTFETPTPVPPTATPVPPTATPVPPTPTPAEAVLGEKTPGALATPIAPVTGTGGPTTSDSFNGLFILIGIAILGTGFALANASHRRNRN